MNENGLRVLTVGNSFSGDGYAYLYEILTTHGVEDVVLSYLYIGGGTLTDHITAIALDSPTYRLHIFDKQGHDVSEEHRFSEVVSLYDWDLIVFQQGSSDSGLPNTYLPAFDTLLYHVKKSANSSAKFAWHMTWAYQQDSEHAAFSNYNYSQATMYEGICTSVERLLGESDELCLLIPCGTAVQNARTSALGDTLTKDGHHLSPFGRYLASYTWYAALTGDDPEELLYTPSDQTLTKTELSILEKAVSSAIQTPFSITSLA